MKRMLTLISAFAATGAYLALTDGVFFVTFVIAMLIATISLTALTRAAELD